MKINPIDKGYQIDYLFFQFKDPDEEMSWKKIPVPATPDPVLVEDMRKFYNSQLGVLENQIMQVKMNLINKQNLFIQVTTNLGLN